MDLACNICPGVVELGDLEVDMHQNRIHIVAVLDARMEAVLVGTLMLPIATHNLCEP